jgi:hypothetical protein
LGVEELALAVMVTGVIADGCEALVAAGGEDIGVGHSARDTNASEVVAVEGEGILFQIVLGTYRVAILVVGGGPSVAGGLMLQGVPAVGTPYLSPQEVAEKGVKVVTLHQGIPGIINGSMMNPYINYPFLPSTVELLHNYTSQSAALGMATRFYYTVRELSNHAAELFALISLQGEMIVDTDPTTIPQPGYCHDVDCHGGGTYLHEHVITNYSECWQQSLPNGEIDAHPTTQHAVAVGYQGQQPSHSSG